jgi:hypothetical protein
VPAEFIGARITEPGLLSMFVCDCDDPSPVGTPGMPGAAFGPREGVMSLGGDEQPTTNSDTTPSKCARRTVNMDGHVPSATFF